MLNKILEYILALFAQPIGGAAVPVSQPSYTAESVKALIFQSVPLGMSRELVFTQAALEIGIEDKSWKPGATFLATKSLFNRHPGSGRGFWDGKTFTTKKGEVLRVFKNPEQSLADYGQLMADGLYARALVNAQAGRKDDFFRELMAAGFEGPEYHKKLESRYQTLRGRGLI